MKKFFEKYNQSTSEYGDRWNAYLKSIETFVCANIPKKKSEVVVLGFGNGNDIPLECISKFNNNILATDIDIKSMSNKKYDENTNIRFVQMDYLSLDFINIDLSNLSQREIVKIIEGIEFDIPHELEFTKFDIILVAPIFSQIFYYSYLDFLVKQNVPITIEIQSALMKKTSEALAHLVKVIKYIGKENSNYFIWQDLLEDKFMYDLLNAEKIILEYTKRYGLSPSIFGVQLLKDELILVDEIYLNWNFNENRNMLVELMYLKKGKTLL
ncbi:hypothetical protein [Helicovermis profundi]|uniref:Class I SAM-dependent methyltransferase n=1 Tax=Helicovermis profundi TaxID=3065157 RepID=A0AAU9ECA2_9FIRM|nr:hypothetical protein HLPR_19080 [Clostridia bacterium S502]